MEQRAKYELLIKDCGDAIQQGRVADAVKVLKNLNLAKLPREWRLPIANLCRRARLLDHGMRALSPVIQERREKIGSPATLEEKCEYATLLQRIGAVQEALKLARTLDANRVPETLFCQVAVHIGQWDFAAAIPLLRRYIELIQDPYRKLIGKVNLVSAMIGDSQNEDGLDLLQDCLSEAKNNSHLRLYANCLELRAQSMAVLGRVSAAKDDLEEASRLIGEGKTIDSLFIAKWKAVIQSKESGSASALREFKKTSEQLKQWENVREAQFQILKIERDTRDFEFLFFGTPYPAYRERIIRELGPRPTKDGIVLGPTGGTKLNVTTGEIEGLPLKIKAGSKTHGLIDTLFRDFYRPLPISEIFSNLFPGEYFNVFSSPVRVRQTVCRARAWLKEHDLPIEISEDAGQYSALIRGQISVYVPSDRFVYDALAFRIEKLEGHFGLQEFTAREARSLLGLSITSFNRLVSSALESGTLTKIGSGPTTRYVVSQSLNDKVAA